MATAIKIPRDVFLQKLKDKLAEDSKNAEINKKRESDHAKIERAHDLDVLKQVMQNKSLIESVFVSYDKTVTIRTKAIEGLSRCPSADLLPTLGNWERNELLQTIAIVELSDAEFVPASITKNASRFLI